MINFDLINDNAIIIAPSELTHSLLREYSANYPGKHIKFIDRNELIRNTYFDYDSESIYHLHKKYGYSYENAIEIMNNLKGIKQGNNKLDNLYNIYLDLKENKMLTFNYYYGLLFRNKTAYVIGYSKDDIELSTALSILHVEANYLGEDSKNYTHFVTVYEDIEDEVDALFKQIIKLNKSGVSLNRIYLFSFNNEYTYLINKYANYYNLAMELESDLTLYDTLMYKDFINLLATNTLEESIEKIKDSASSELYNSLITIINEIGFLKLDNDEFIEFLNALAKKREIKKDKYEESIKLCNENSIINDDEYAFIVGFTLDTYPRIYRDTDFYSDKEKLLLNKNTSYIKSKINHDNQIEFIKNTKNLFISYKKSMGKTVYYPSLLIKELDMKEVNGDTNNIRYSTLLSKLEVANYKDLYRNYRYFDKRMNNYTSEELSYCSYDYHYNGKNKLSDDKKLVLSYSQIDDYNRCPFRYFVSRILDVTSDESTFELNLGNLFHKILEDSIDKDINLDDYNEDIKKNFTLPSEQYFIHALLDQVMSVVEKNNTLMKNSTYTKAIPEQTFTIHLKGSSDLYGKIDKVLMDEESKNYAIIDYKSGKFNFDKNKIPYGFGMQLPIYYLLVKDKYKDKNLLGLYIQNICVDHRDGHGEPYKLKGINLPNNKVEMANFDKSLTKESPISKYLDSLRLKDSEITYDETSEETFNKIIEDTTRNVLSTEESIRNGKFEVAPRKYKKSDNAPCEFCDYRSICYRRPRDIVVAADSDEEEGEEDEV